MGKKKSASETKAVPSMYPRQERVTYRSDDPTVDTKAMLAGLDVESWRMDIKGRLEVYTAMLREIVLPHYGGRPGDFTPKQWSDISYRERTLWELPASAPWEARDAFNGLRTIHRIRDELKAVDGNPDAAQRAVCWAIDLGLLLVRVQTQLFFGPTVAAGNDVMRGRDRGGQKTSDKSKVKYELWRVDFERRMSERGHVEGAEGKILSAMSVVKDSSGKLVYGTRTTLGRYWEKWKLNTAEQC